jgi:putative two-component system response regulator
VKESVVKANILIVEDDLDDRDYAAGILRPHYEIDFAANAQEARGKLIGWPPDLLLCDLYMPGEPGMDLAETILATRRDEIAVVMVTGLNDPELAERALELGASGYLVKPYRREDLLDMVSDALREKRLKITGTSQGAGATRSAGDSRSPAP